MNPLVNLRERLPLDSPAAQLRWDHHMKRTLA
jgi:hypothetical protein